MTINPEKTLLLCVLAGTLLVATTSIPLIRTPFQIDYGEGLMMDGAERIRHSQPLYPDPFGFPVVLQEYGPVAYEAIALVVPSQGISFAAGRWLIVGCAFAISLLLGGLVWRGSRSVWLGFSFGLLLLTLPTFRFWLYLVRSDLIGLVCSMIGITLYLSGKRPYWSIPFFGLGLFSKYTLMAAPLGVFAHLLLQRKHREGFTFLGVLGIACFVPFEVLQYETGHWFAFHMFSIHADPFSLIRYLGLAAVVMVSAPVVTALAIWYALGRLRSREPSFTAVYLVMGTLVALTAGKIGSSTNHFLEWMLASCLCAGLGYSELLRERSRKAVPIAILLSASVLAGVIAQNQPALQPTRELADCGKAYEYVRNSPSAQVFADSVGPLLVAGKPVMVSDPFAYGQLLKHGAWPDRRLEQLLNERYFALIVMQRDPAQLRVRGSEVWPESIVDAINRNYQIAARFNCRYADVMLEPKP